MNGTGTNFRRRKKCLHNESMSRAHQSYKSYHVDERCTNLHCVNVILQLNGTFYKIEEKEEVHVSF